MEVFIVQRDGSEELVASDLDAVEVGELWEWWRYTKPFGPDLKIVIRPNFSESASVTTTGTEGAPAPHSEVFIG